jgi:hypothetical protein
MTRKPISAPLWSDNYAAIRSKAPVSLSETQEGTVILFADGLRFDVAQKLRQKLTERGLQSELTWRWTALPTVTPTAKPGCSPIAELFTGDEACQEFRPRIRDSGKDVTSDRFRQLLEERGCQPLDDRKIGQPDGIAWLEYGSVDTTGHKEGWKLAKRIQDELNGLGEVVGILLRAGWKKVHIVTDHGWLLMPGGLPKVELPEIPGRDALEQVRPDQGRREKRLSHSSLALG